MPVLWAMVNLSHLAIEHTQLTMMAMVMLTYLTQFQMQWQVWQII